VRGTAEERLRARLTPGADGCILWTGTTSPDGYGRIWVEGRIEGAHRLAYALANGPIPDGAYVLHRCDVRACCNAAHLFLGDHAANMADMDAKGRRASLHGASNPRAKLTPEQVAEIRGLTGVISQRVLGERFGISKTMVRHIIKGRRWREFPVKP
jgi:hypothetical protein